MTAVSLPDALAQASKEFGITPGYWAIDGKYHETSDAMRQAILRPLGIPCDSAEELSEALESRRASRQSRLAGPVLVVLESAGAVRVTVRTTEARVSVSLRLEEGLTRGFELDVEDGVITLPEPLPAGYHSADLTAGDRTAQIRIIVCPDKAWLPDSLQRGERRAGLAVSLFGVRSAQTWGCGDFTALRGLIDWVAGFGGAYIALNPLHAIHNRQPFNTSPYLPNSTFYRNFIYLDVDAVPEMKSCLVARALRRHASIVSLIEAANNSEFVEYEKTAGLKQRFLKLLWDHFEREEIATDSARAQEYLAFVEREGELLDRYATYCALDEYLHAQDPDVWIWPDWPEKYRDPDSPAVQQFRTSYRHAIGYHKYVQWLLDAQAAETQAYARARGLETGLFHDLPLATDSCGSELWANRRFFVDGCRVGAPPDDFSPKGQDWSFPPPAREAHREDGYRMFAESIRKFARHGGALRIDHVMRLFRLYWIPEGHDATEGAYVQDYYEDLLPIIALESHRNQVLIVGEDLGTVEPYMREALNRFGILSYRLFYFEKRGDGSMIPARDYPAQALVSSTTHDLPTLAGFWSGRDIETRRSLGLLPDDHSYEQARWYRSEDKRRMASALQEAGLLPPVDPGLAAASTELTGELHGAITGFLVSTPSMLMTLNQEDLTKEQDQQNMPGTTWQYPNWKRKMKFTVEQLQTEPLARDFAAMFRFWLAKANRASSGS